MKTKNRIFSLLLITILAFSFVGAINARNVCLSYRGDGTSHLFTT